MSSAHELHDFDGEPVQALPPDEPLTPGWIPALGLALFLAAAVAYLAKTSDAPPQEGAAPVAPVATAPVARAPAAAMPSSTATAQVVPATGGGGVMQRTPEEMKEIQRKVQEAMARRAQQGGQAPPAAGGPAPAVPARPVPAAPVAPAR